MPDQVEIIMEAFAELKLTVPKTQKLRNVGRGNYIEFRVQDKIQSKYHPGDESWIRIPHKPDEPMSEKNVRSVHRLMTKTYQTFTELLAIDNAFNLSYLPQALFENGSLTPEDLKPVGFDTAFLNWAGLYGVQADEIEAMIYNLVRTRSEFSRPLITTTCMPPVDVCETLRRGFSNYQPYEVEEAFGRRYTNMHLSLTGTALKLPMFQGCAWGKKPFAADFQLGDWLYMSSKTPTMISRARLPESAMNALKGRAINDLIDKPIFSQDQKIIHVMKLKNDKTSITLQADIQPFAYGQISKSSGLLLKAT